MKLVREKKKNNNVCILMHIYRKMVLMKLSAVETQILRTDLWTQLGKEEGELCRYGESNRETYIMYNR